MIYYLIKIIFLILIEEILKFICYNYESSPLLWWYSHPSFLLLVGVCVFFCISLSYNSLLLARTHWLYKKNSLVFFFFYSLLFFSFLCLFFLSLCFTRVLFRLIYTSYTLKIEDIEKYLLNEKTFLIYYRSMDYSWLYTDTLAKLCV
jgi:hypothetical protein